MAHLANILAEEREKQEKGLNKLAADESLERIQKLAAEQRNEFDALDFVGEAGCGSGDTLWNSEEFHSNVLAWLLAPERNHGIGDRFLTCFLLQAGIQPIGHSRDWAETEVTREWFHVVDGQSGYLDILIVNHTRQILCAIENKVCAPEFGDQLTRYRKALDESSYSTFTKYLVFLTPRGTSPAREDEQKQWKSLTYSRVFDIVQQIVDNHEIPTRAGVRAFLNQYATTLRRNIMPERLPERLSKLVRKTYFEHRDAIELIIDYKPNLIAEASQWLKEAIEQQPEWLLDLETQNYIRFRSVDWDRYDSTRTGSGWAPTSHALFLFEFTFSGKTPPRLNLALSPANEANNGFRQRLFEAVRQHPQLFRCRAGTLTKNWVNLHSGGYILDEDDFGVGWDDGTTRDKLEKWLADFAANEFSAMNEIIVGCLQEIDAEEQTL